MRPGVLAAALAAGVALCAAPTATAAEEPAPVGVVVQHDDGTVRQAIRVADLYPTASREVVLFVDGDGPDDVRRMRLTVGNLVDSENDCLRPEVSTGDTSCGDSGGELSGYLRMTFTPGLESGSGSDRSCAPAGGAVVSREFTELTADPAVAGLAADSGRLCVVTEVTHVERPGDNVTQTDATTFDLTIAFDGRTVVGGTGADGAQAPVEPTVIDAGDDVDLGLADTGVPISALLLVAGLVLGAGAALLLAGRRPTGRHVPEARL